MDIIEISMNLTIIILLLSCTISTSLLHSVYSKKVNNVLLKSITSYEGSKLTTCLHASVDSYIQEARELLSSNVSDSDIMKVAVLLVIKENEKGTALKDKEKETALLVAENEKGTALLKREAQVALSMKENYYLKKLSILSQRYHMKFYLLIPLDTNTYISQDNCWKNSSLTSSIFIRITKNSKP